MELLLEKKIGFRFRSEASYNFFIVGAGGTGGHLISNLSRIVSLKNDEAKEFKHTITLIDADEVENKNLVRQNFVQSDIGKNKAEVLARRYTNAYGTPINYVSEYIEGPVHLLKIIQSVYVNKSQTSFLRNIEEVENNATLEDYSTLLNNTLHDNVVTVLIDCTDNNKTRLILKTVADTLSASQNVVMISSGNEERNGQVIISFYDFTRNQNKNKLIKHTDSKDGGLSKVVKPVSTPTFFDIFPNAKMDKLPTELSCAESAVSAPQNIGANINAANIIFDFVNKLIHNLPIYESAIFFDIDTMNRSTYYFTTSDITKLLKFVPDNPALFTFVSGIDTAPAITWQKVVEQAEIEKKKEQKKLQDLLLGKEPKEDDEVEEDNEELIEVPTELVDNEEDQEEDEQEVEATLSLFDILAQQINN